MSGMEMRPLADPLLGDDSQGVPIGEVEEESHPCGRHLCSKIKIIVGWRELITWDLWRAALAELIAVVLFVFVGVGTVVGERNIDSQDTLIVIALAHGFAIAVLASSTAHISGGHVNPAVSFAMMLTGNISIIRGCVYIVFHIVASALGAALLAACVPRHLRDDWQHELNTNLTALQGFIIEVVLTFVLLFTIFANAVDKRGSNIIAPYLIGLAVAIDHLMAVPLTGASMNPARSFGPAFVNGDYLKHYYIYWFGPMAGATLAAFVYRLFFLRGQSKETHTIASLAEQIKALERKLQ